MKSNSRALSRWLMLIAKVSAAVVLAWTVAYVVFLAPVTIPRIEVKRGSIVSEILGTGTLEARVKAIICPRISGRLASILVDQNDRVTAGQLLATLDDGDLRQKVKVARADLGAAAAEVDRSAADIARAEARSRQARRQYDRLAPMRNSGTVNLDELDKATEDRDIADAVAHDPKHKALLMTLYGAGLRITDSESFASATSRRSIRLFVLPPTRHIGSIRFRISGRRTPELTTVF